MKLAYSLLIFLAVAGCTLKDPQPNTSGEFIKFFGNAQNDVAKGMIPVSGGFLVVGSTKSYSGNEQAFVVKTDGNGNKIWQYAYGIDSTSKTSTTLDADSSVTVARSALELESGNFLVLGEGKSTKPSRAGIDTTNFMLYEISPDGDLVSVKTYATSSKFDQGYYLSAVNGGYLMIGTTDDGSTTGGNLKAIKINTARDSVLFERTEGITNAPDNFGNIIEVATDDIDGTIMNDFLWAGTSSRDVTDTDMRVIRLNDIGGIRWEENYTKLDQIKQTGSEIIKLSGKSEFAIVGSTAPNSDTTKQDVFVVKIDVKGAVQGTPIIVDIPNQQKGVSIKETSDGGFIIAGNTDAGTITPSTASKAFLLKVAPDGTQEWMQEFGDVGIDENEFNTAQFVHIVDGGYLLLGTFSFSGTKVLGFIRTDSQGRAFTR